MLKQTDRVIKVGDYYQIEAMEDFITQKSSKKEEIASSVSIPPPLENILTDLPTQKQAIANLYYSPNPTKLIEDMSLNQCSSSLQLLLKQPITDEQRREIEKILKQIAQVKNNGELPLNQIPIRQQNQKQASKKVSAPQEIILKSPDLDIERLEKDIQGFQQLKFLQVSKLQNLVGILLGEIKGEAAQPQQIDQKTKQDIDTIYNSIHSLKCLNDITGIMHSISSNETKFIQISNWVQELEQTLNLNKEILQQFQNDELALQQLETNFNANISQVKSIIKKLNQ